MTLLLFIFSMCYSVRQSKRLFNTVVNFHPKNSYDHPFKIFILGRIHRTQPMYVFNLIQDRMIDNCAAVFQTHGDRYQKNDRQLDADADHHFLFHAAIPLFSNLSFALDQYRR